jgi:hypothetical protein
MTITNDLVETFLKCPTKCFLRSCGEAGTGNLYAAWVEKVMPMDTPFRRFHASDSLLAFLESI